jgi:hypothetical protein
LPPEAFASGVAEACAELAGLPVGGVAGTCAACPESEVLGVAEVWLAGVVLAGVCVAGVGADCGTGCWARAIDPEKIIRTANVDGRMGDSL